MEASDVFSVSSLFLADTSIEVASPALSVTSWVRVRPTWSVRPVATNFEKPACSIVTV